MKDKEKREKLQMELLLYGILWFLVMIIVSAIRNINTVKQRFLQQLKKSKDSVYFTG